MFSPTREQVFRLREKKKAKTPTQWPVTGVAQATKRLGGILPVTTALKNVVALIFKNE